jgi:hypothetical protein
MGELAPELALRGICAELTERGRNFALVGGLAVSIRAEVRFTRDVDIAVSVENDEDAEARSSRAHHAARLSSRPGSIPKARICPCYDEILTAPPKQSLPMRECEAASARSAEAELVFPGGTRARGVADAGSRRISDVCWGMSSDPSDKRGASPDANGVDRAQIREMLRLTPQERLLRVQEFVESVLEIRKLNETRSVR